MKIVNQPSQLPPATADLPRPLVLVPTMGALHGGHLALIRRAREIAGENGSVALTLFVNPTQFDRAEDLKKYPRTLEHDLNLCRQESVDLVFAPEANTMYHPDHSVSVTETSLTNKLCGATRPGHFDGVCTIVLKLFNLAQPDTSVFGKKDYQQLAVIRRMVRDLNIPVRIEGVDTVREPSGLAMSSRNTRLTDSQLADAPRIRNALLAAQAAHAQGETSANTLLGIARRTIESSTEGAEIDYLELLDAENLQTIETVASPALMATAVFYGTLRLIDNISIS